MGRLYVFVILLFVIFLTYTLGCDSYLVPDCDAPHRPVDAGSKSDQRADVIRGSIRLYPDGGAR